MCAPATLAMLACWSGAGAGQWEITPRIASDLIYTTNIGLRPEPLAEDELILAVSPGIRIAGESERFQADVDYYVDALFFERQDDVDEVLQFMDASGVGTLISDTLLVGFAGAFTQQVIDPSQPIPANGLSRAGNFTEVVTASINPHFVRSLGRARQLRIGYRYGIIEYEQPELADSKSGEWRLDLTGRPPGSALSWGVELRDTTIDYDTGITLEFARAAVDVGWEVVGDTSVVVLGGVEDVDLGPLIAIEDVDGPFWQVGLRGSLGALTKYEVLGGEAYYGDLWTVNFERTAGRLTVTVDYGEETTTVGRQQLDAELLLRQFDVTGSELPLVTPEIYTRETLSGSAVLALNKGSVSLRVYDEDREYRTVSPDPQLSSADGIAGTAFRWTWQARDDLELRFNLAWERLDLRNIDERPEDVRARIELERRLSRQLSFNFAVTRNQRGSASPVNEFTETAASIGVSKRF